MLHFCLKNGLEYAARFFIRHKADVNAKDKNGVRYRRRPDSNLLVLVVLAACVSERYVIWYIYAEI